jgi:RNA polymerase sigma-70 factor, ECF subfamily
MASVLAADIGLIPAPASIDPVFLDELWQSTEAESCGLTQTEFSGILLQLIATQNEKQLPSPALSTDQQAAFLRALKLPDLLLAQACARGIERAWERFITLYRQPLTRAAIAITGSEILGRDLADALYAELYGLNTREGSRRCPLDSYQGRGSLLGWLRTTLAQRHVDHHRRSHRETSLEDHLQTSEPAAHDTEPPPAAQPTIIGKAVAAAFAQHPPEDRFLLTAYYLDQRTLHQIGRLLQVHEATVSRKLHRITKDLRKQVTKNLQSQGLSKRAAEEALTTDPRDVDLNIRKILQTTQSDPFPDQAFPEKPGQ